MITISLPSYAYEQDLPGLLDRLGAGDAADKIMVDFSRVTFWTPGALVALLAKLHTWDAQKKDLTLDLTNKCPAFRYLQRINFFAVCGLRVAENFSRHDAGSRFVELRQLGGKEATDVAELSTDIAYCLFPEADVDDPEQSGLFDVLQYSVSELANNVLQHAKAPGFVSAQYTGKTDLIRVAIADRGIGVLRSFAENNSPLYKPEWTDTDAIVTALKPKVSSKLHLPSPWGEPVNAGVGLTLMKEICLQTGGHFFLASGNGTFLQLSGSEIPQQKLLPSRYQGTVCVLAFVREKVKSFPDLMHQVKTSVGLLPNGGKFGKFFS